MKHIVLLLTCAAFVGNLFAQPFAPNRDPADNPFVATRSLTFNGDLRPFFHGVASGDPTASSVMIWTRVTPEEPGPVTVTYQVATSLAFDNIVADGEVTTDEDRDYTVKVDVSGLAAGSTYYYYFTALDGNSLVGRAKTTPEGGVDHLRFGVASCSNYEGGYFNAYGALAERNDLDAVLHLGDYIYEYGPGVYGLNLPERVNEPGNEILSVSDYRTRYSLYRLDPDLIRLHQQHTVISVWDDHESANDSYVDGAENHQPDTEGSWEERRNISKQVYFEWMPMRDNADQSIYRTFSYGDLCDLIMLDTRLEGRVEPPANFDDVDEPVRTIISETQFDWLIDNLRNSEAQWKVLGNQVLFSTFNVGFAAGAFDGVPDPTNIDSVRVAENTFIDNWESYPTQRNAVIDSLRELGIDNTVIVTGDSHSSWAFDVTKEPVLYPRPEFLNIPQPNPYNSDSGEGYDPDNGDGSWAVEFGTPSISSPNFDEALGAALTAQYEFLMNNPVPGIG
ncbi:MAG: alkaline phosphatase D family protein, partial [Bacteroidota bacterium]